MLEISADSIRLRPDHDTWEAVYLSNRLTGPETLALAGQELIRGCETCLDDIPDGSAVVTDFRAVRRSGAALVTTSGYLPFGNPIQFRQQTVHAGNHARTTLDIEWPVEARVRKRFGIASLFLPGRWQRFCCVAPAAQSGEDATPVWTTVPVPDAAALPLILGQWRRPPLALVLEREDGTRFETGTGSDLWRWEHAFGYGRDSGNYRLVLESGGVRFVREPLVCDAEFVPDARKFRLTWYAAWGKAETPRPAMAAVAARELEFTAAGTLAPVGAPGANAAADLRDTPLILDFRRLPVRPNWQRCGNPAELTAEARRGVPCWEENAVHKRARQVIRQLAAWPAPGRLRIRGLAPGVCWDAAHVYKNAPEGRLHWDIGAILDFAAWTRQKLGPDWEISAEIPEPWDALPSLQQLFAPNGFPSATASADE